MKKSIKFISVILLLLLAISCKKKSENLTVDSIINEYKTTTNKEFLSKYKNVKLILEGTVVFYSQNKEKPGNEYYVIFDSTDIDYEFLTGTYVSCVLYSKNKLEVGDRISVLCSFDKLYKSLLTDDIGFKKGRIIK